MYCQKCGKELTDSAKFCDECGAAVTTSQNSLCNMQSQYPQKSKTRNPVLGIVLLIVGIILIVVSVIGGTEDTPKKTTPTGESITETIQDNFFTVGDTVALKDVHVTFNDFKLSSSLSGNYPEDGNTFAVCEFIIDNQSNIDIAVSSLVSFSAYADDYAASLSIPAMVFSGKKQLDGAISAGKKMQGVVAYEIPEEWETFQINYTCIIGSKPIEFVVKK